MCHTLYVNFAHRVNNYIKNNTVNSRTQAYDICYAEFNNARISNNYNYDYLALHLYAFLASWGMVCRGNYLMQHNYKVLIPVAKIVCNKKYNSLLNIDVFNKTFNQNNYINLMMDLKTDLKKALCGGIKTNITDTLLSKIVHVTLGCVVCYDKNVNNNLRKLKYKASYTKQGLNDLVNFANANKNDILTLQKTYAKYNYSIMKICDCALY